MDKDLRKRLEEAAREFEPDAFDEDMILPMREGYVVSRIRGGFKAGAEYGYKEAITQAKEWMKKNTFTNKLYGLRPIQYWDFATQEQMLTDFESDMNKLWEEME